MGATAATLLKSLWPFAFWRRITMAQTMRLRAILMYLALLILTLPLLYVLVWGGIALYVRISVGRELQLQHARVPNSIASIEAYLALPDNATYFQQFPHQTVDEQRAVLRKHLTQLTLMAAQPPQVRLSWFVAVSESIWFPFARTSVGAIEPAAWGEYPAPADLLPTFQFLVRTAGSGFAMEPRDYWESAGMSASLLVLGMTFGLLFPAALVLLPITRRRAKVRWAHIGRVVLYSLFIPILAIWLATAAFAVSLVLVVLPVHPQVLMPAFCGASLLLFWFWWAIAIRRYLRLPHAWAVSALLGLLVLLAVPVVIAAIGTAVRWV